MKRVKCPKCDNFITFDETKYSDGQRLVFQCPECNKQFAIRMGVSKVSATQRDENPDEEADGAKYGWIVVIENVFHYKQVIPLRLGDNVIGKYQKGNSINTPITTQDPSMDLTHCIITVSKRGNGGMKYILRDGPSNTGTFVGTEILPDRDRRIIDHGTVFTCGATSIILKTHEDED